MTKPRVPVFSLHIAPRRAFAAVLCLAMAHAPQATAGSTAPAEAIAALEATLGSAEAQAIRAVLDPSTLLPRSAVLRSPRLVAALYAVREHRPIWRDGAAILSLRAALNLGELDGLAPGELRLPEAMDPLEPGVPMPPALRDVLLTDTLLTLADRLANGIADARGLAPGDDQPLRFRDVATSDIAGLSSSLDAGDIADIIASARPATALYARLRAAIAIELQRRADGGLPRIGAGPTLEQGSMGDRVVRLRARLTAGEGFTAMPSRHWDETLAAAVAAFQSRNGLETDGKVGQQTLAALDRSSQGRIDALRVNLERARWFARELGDDDRIVVNIPDYAVSLHLDGEPVWHSRVVVGSRRNRTPVFVGSMTDVVLDPTWTVPRSIVAESLFDEAFADPAAFSAKGYRLRDLGGVMNDPVAIDWDGMTLERFHYDVVQMPGPGNALGQVKFRFDNPYSVYLHDTPAKSLFDEVGRAFSHGCVRVQAPHELERLVLQARGGLDRAAIESLRISSDNVSVDLEQPLAVGLLYWTADVDEEGRLRILPDVYGRDAPVLDALDGMPVS